VEAVTCIAVLTVAPFEGVLMVREVPKAAALKSSNAAIAKYKFFTEFSFFSGVSSRAPENYRGIYSGDIRRKSYINSDKGLRGATVEVALCP
jgi:hypothetical protein